MPMPHERGSEITDLSEAGTPVPGIRAPPGSPAGEWMEESSSSEQVPDAAGASPKQMSGIASVWSLFSSYVRRAVSAACPVSCRPGGGIELSRAAVGGRPAHVCIAEVAMDVDVILTGSTGVGGLTREAHSDRGGRVISPWRKSGNMV
ncbi:hypothetical protein FOZ63_014881 [Perkinsus olseni]|uniref:Uncharacterized protein n=1 Tax=Perkinsus olseni TaxID=32597 RepID=A0A7J6QYU6_PEROL|nr:hypothetical protein FOZ63_014881 [Perkinsus olseni]